MITAERIWKLARDILLTVGGLGLLYLVALGVPPESLGTLLIPTAGGFIAAPAFLRSDERKRRRGETDED